jgi:hypothetical protein
MYKRFKLIPSNPMVKVCMTQKEPIGKVRLVLTEILK